MQAIKVLNMIKLYGKPIRVNKVRMFIFFVTNWQFLNDHLGAYKILTHHENVQLCANFSF